MAQSALRRSVSTERIVAWGVTGAVTLFVLRQLYPSFVLRDTTPASGDLAGHVNAIAHLRDDLLHHGRITGWSHDWLTGFPSFTFYFPLAGLLATVLSLVLPFTVAVKLVVALAPLAVPVVAYAFGRLNGCDRLTSSCFAVATVPLLLQPSIYFVGGSIGADVGGLFGYGLALACGLLAVGVARAGLRTGRSRALTAGLLAATLLLHIVPAVAAVVGVVVATVVRPARARLRWSGSVLVTAGALVAFWIVPFVLRGRFTAGSEAPGGTSLLDWLFPFEMLPVVVLALVGSVVTLTEGERTDELKVFLLAVAGATALLVIVDPIGRGGPGRFVPVWLLWLCLLAGYGLAGTARTIDRFRQRRARGRSLDNPVLAALLLPIIAFGAFLPLYDSRDWQQGLLTKTAPPFVSKAADIQFRGYERSLDKPVYQDLLRTVRSAADEAGCGRAHLEIAPSASPTALRRQFTWLFPMLTDGCITVSGGLYVQSTPTSSFVEAVNAKFGRLGPEGAAEPTAFAEGIAGLRSLGVRYLIATSTSTARAADNSPELRPVARTKSYEGGRFWEVYEISGVEVVEPLGHLPVVVPEAGRSRTSWEEAAAEWYEEGAAPEVVVAESGPSGWPRAEQVSDDLPRRPTGEEVTVSRVRVDQDRLSFRVSRTGVPVLVKMSYFPNWKASGAEGPWRVTPNQMVVVPTSETVTLQYGYSSVEYAGWLGTLGGIGALVFLARRPPVGMPEPAPRPEPVRPPREKAPPRPQGPAKRKKRRR